MIYLSTNLKYLRELKGWKQSDVSAMLGVGQNTITNYEKGNSKPDYETLLKLSEIYSISVDNLLFKNIKDVEVINNSDAKGELIALDMSGYKVLNVPLVNQYAYAGFLGGYSDITYIDSLPKIPIIVDKEYKGNYIGFEVKGYSMDDGSRDSLIPGDIVIAREIPKSLWQESKLHIKKWSKFVIAHKTEGVIVKNITEHNVAKGTIKIHSLNPDFEDEVLFVNDIHRIFNVVIVDRRGK